MIYTDKAKEEVLAMLSLYKQSFKDVYGYPPNKDEIIERLKDIIKEKQDSDFRSRFATLSPYNLLQLIESFEEKRQETKGLLKKASNKSNILET